MKNILVRLFAASMGLALAGSTALGQTTSDPAAPNPATTAISKELRIIRITPQGEDVPLGRQIVIQFNRPVVPIGKMERSRQEIPVTTTPELNCEWRWLNTSALSCNLTEKDQLQSATSYSLTINPGIIAEDGATISAVQAHKFITERPDVRFADFNTWKSPSHPVLRPSSARR